MTTATQNRGFFSILFDVDPEDAVVLAAMERAGHHAVLRPCYV